MSGWDVSSTPTWGPQDGPEETPAFTTSGDGGRDHGQDFGASEFGGGYQGEGMAGGPPPEFFGQGYGQEEDLGPSGYPQRTPGQSFQDLPMRESRGRHGGARADDGYGQESGYGQDSGYGDSAFGQDWGRGGADQGGTWAADGQDNDGSWERTAGRSAPPWDERQQQDASFVEADGAGFGRQDFGRQQEGPSFSAREYDGQDFPGQQGRGGQAPMDFGRTDRDMSARSDPALQDFFAPTRGGGDGFSDARPEWSGGGSPRDSFQQDADVDWTGRPKARPPADADVDWTGRPRGQRPAPRGPRRDEDDDDSQGGGIGTKGLVAIGAVVVVVVAAGAYMFLHKGGSSSPTASSTPPANTMTSPAAHPSGSKAAGTGAAGGGTGTTAAGFTLSTPSTAGGYPLGQNPNDLTNSKATAQQVMAAVSAGGGGTAKGSPVSAAYTLPASQVMTFVGYQGTFTPAKVATILSKLGTNPNTYPAGPNGGVLGCANTTTTPSGAVCVWSTSSTLGITEFYDATGPETLNASQAKGANDTVKIRADVEKKS